MASEFSAAAASSTSFGYSPGRDQTSSAFVKDFTEFRRGGWPLLGSTIGAGCGLSSVCFYTHGVFAVAIANDTGWSRGGVQGAVSIMILMAVVTAPIVGWLVDRLGARRVALWSVPAFGLTLALLSLSTDQIGTYYAAWVLMSIVGAGTLPTTWTKVVIGWFDDYRGIALGLTLAGTGIAATLAPAYAGWLIGQVGWRGAYVGLAITVMVIALPAVFGLFRSPAGAVPGFSGAAIKLEGLALGQALRGYRFWVIAVGILLVAAGISGLITNLVPLLTDKGLSAATAAGYAGLLGVSVIVGRLLVGFLLDRVWAPLIACVFLAAPSLAAFLLSADSLAPSWIAAAALMLGLAAGAELDLMAFLASRYFGLRHYGAIYGGLYVAFSLGAGLAPAAFGRVYDQLGNYSSALAGVIAFSLVGALMMLTLGRYPDQPGVAR